MNVGMFPFLLNQWDNLEGSDNGQQHSELLPFRTLSIIQYSKPENVLEAESASILKYVLSWVQQNGPITVNEPASNPHLMFLL